MNGPYQRSMASWWKRDPFFVAYMARELTAFAVLAYAIVLAVGCVRLAQGEAAFNGWLAALASPLGILLNLVVLFSMLVHAKSWFDIMPKTMPMMFRHGHRVPPATITLVGYAGAIGAAVVVLLLAAWWQA